ncbi:hypothetical protein BDZ91DRAFT_709095 [Kalaharituber pfeilii]|nr:hypothetical protein BDZ91DRAFT_709095 [Kalaharituber pfeilii]
MSTTTTSHCWIEKSMRNPQYIAGHGTFCFSNSAMDSQLILGPHKGMEIVQLSWLGILNFCKFFSKNWFRIKIFNENIKSSSDLGHNDFLLAGGFTASGPLCIHRTQQGRHRPNSLNLQRLRSDSPVPTLKLTRSMSNETLKLTKSPSAPISAHQGRLPFTSKSRRRRDPQDIEKANGYASVSSRRNWLHIV